MKNTHAFIDEVDGITRTFEARDWIDGSITLAIFEGVHLHEGELDQDGLNILSFIALSRENWLKLFKGLLKVTEAVA